MWDEISTQAAECWNFRDQVLRLWILNSIISNLVGNFSMKIMDFVDLDHRISSIQRQSLAGLATARKRPVKRAREPKHWFCNRCPPFWQVFWQQQCCYLSMYSFLSLQLVSSSGYKFLKISQEELKINLLVIFALKSSLQTLWCNCVVSTLALWSSVSHPPFDKNKTGTLAFKTFLMALIAEGITRRPLTRTPSISNMNPKLHLFCLWPWRCELLLNNIFAVWSIWDIWGSALSGFRCCNKQVLLAIFLVWLLALEAGFAGLSWPDLGPFTLPSK